MKIGTIRARFTIRTLALLIGFLCPVCQTVAQPGVATPKPLAPAIKSAWEKEGAVFGWMSPTESLSGFIFRKGETEGRIGELPAFRLIKMKKSPKAIVPPTQPFGLYLAELPVSDPLLDDLTGFAELYLLDLKGSNITDVGLDKLAKISSLRMLDLARTRVTDAGLSKLVGLDYLNYLGLQGTRVTDKGLTNLTRYTRLETICLDSTKGV